MHRRTVDKSAEPFIKAALSEKLMLNTLILKSFYLFYLCKVKLRKTECTFPFDNCHYPVLKIVLAF